LADPATVSSFRLDKYPVTVGRFRQFVNAVWPPDGGAGWLPVAGSGKHAHLNAGMGLVNVDDEAGVDYETGWAATDDFDIAATNTYLACANATWTPLAGSNENLPVNCVSWWESYAFCIWDGGFLPSEAEWEYAAAGGSEQREYPWGSTAPGTANQYAVYGCYYPNASGGCTAKIAPVGFAAHGAGLWGQLDLAGNLWEWNLDSYAAAYVDPCVDCANLTGTDTTNSRTNRGGDIYSPASYLMPPYRGGGDDPEGGVYVIGLRCARSP
jgi:formylglycine-generating enzyme required for sulfatase activity